MELEKRKFVWFPFKGAFSASSRQIPCDFSIPHYIMNLWYKNSSLSRSYRSPHFSAFRTIPKFAQVGNKRQKFAGQRRRQKTNANFPKPLAAQNAVKASGAGKKRSAPCRVFPATAPTGANLIWLSRARRRRTAPLPPFLSGDTVWLRALARPLHAFGHLKAQSLDLELIPSGSRPNNKIIATAKSHKVYSNSYT